MQPNQQKRPGPPRTEEENNRAVGALAGGAILGASIAGPPGAILGGLVGLILGEIANDESKKKGRK